MSQQAPLTVGTGSRRGKRAPAAIVSATALTVLAFGGYIKGSRLLEWVPVDITVLAAVAVIVITANHLLAKRPLPRRTGLLLLWYASLLGGLAATTSPANTYAAAKVFHVFVLAPLCMLGGAFLLETPGARRMWLKTVVALGFLTVAIAFVAPSSGGSDRLAAEGGTTIGLGRAAGAALVVLGTTAVSQRKYRVRNLALAAAAGYALLLTASRGPVLSAIFAIAVSLLVSRSHANRWVLAAVAALFGLGLSWAASGAVDQRLFEIGGASAAARKSLFSYALDATAGSPFGIGWGGLYEHMGFALLDSGYTQYPHNLVLEVFSEGGWVAGLMTLVVLAVALRDQKHRSSSSPEDALLGLLIFCLANSLVSGDISGNRGLWLVVGAALASVRDGTCPSPPRPGSTRPAARTTGLQARRPRGDRVCLLPFRRTLRRLT